MRQGVKALEGLGSDRSVSREPRFETRWISVTRKIDPNARSSFGCHTLGQIPWMRCLKKPCMMHKGHKPVPVSFIITRLLTRLLTHNYRSCSHSRVNLHGYQLTCSSWIRRLPTMHLPPCDLLQAAVGRAFGNSEWLLGIGDAATPVSACLVELDGSCW